MIDFVIFFFIVWVLFYNIPVLFCLLTCEIYNFVTVEVFQHINTLPSINFKAITPLGFSYHPCYCIIKIANVKFCFSLSSTGKSVDNPNVQKNWGLKYPNKTYTQESLSGEDYILTWNLENKVRMSEEHLFQI